MNEAIQKIKRVKGLYAYESDYEALDMAIAALEKQERDSNKCCETCKYKDLPVSENPCDECYFASDYEDYYEAETAAMMEGQMENREAISQLESLNKEVSIYSEAIDLAIAALEKQEQNRWIPVTERLPEQETDVLICNADGDIAISRGSMSTESTGSWIWYTSGWRFGKVTAWRPLHEPYTEDEA